MAVNTSRSMNASLDAGRGDGTVRKTAPDRGGVIEPSTMMMRTGLHPDYGYGFFDETVHVTGEALIPR